LDVLGDIFAEEEDLKKLMWSPYFTPQQKAVLLQRVFSGKFSELTMNFMMVATGHNRIRFMPEIVVCFNRLWDKLRRVVPVKITVSRELDEQRLRKLSDDIEALLEQKIRMESYVDPSIIGGIIIRYGDRVIDNTVRTRLSNAVKTTTSAEKRWMKFDEV
jgi:F-type H+-transporting ATPase subunit delta